MKPVIIKPTHDGHCGDTFRELIDLWEENNLVTVKKQNVFNCWMNEEKDILLYDKPTMQWYHPLRDFYNYALFGNPKATMTNSSNWIFWGRRPRLMEQVINDGRLPFSERKTESIFLGKVENNIQNVRRTGLDWSDAVTEFSMPIRGHYKYNQTEYLYRLRESRYGLCLAGYGYKCNREIELLSMGTVPIITHEVDLSYYNELVENVHYIRVGNPEEIKDLIDSITESEWEYMSENGIQWYEDNCSTIGSFKTTMNILKNYH